MRTFYLSILAAISGVFAIGSLLLIQAKSQPHAAPLWPPPMAPFPRTISASGIVESSGRNVAVAAPVPGQATQVFVHKNEIVRLGAPLFQLNNRPQQEAASAAEAQAERSRRNLSSQQFQVRSQQAAVRAAASDAKAGKQLQPTRKTQRAATACCLRILASTTGLLPGLHKLQFRRVPPYCVFGMQGPLPDVPGGLQIAVIDSAALRTSPDAIREFQSVIDVPAHGFPAGRSPPPDLQLRFTGPLQFVGAELKKSTPRGIGNRTG